MALPHAVQAQLDAADATLNAMHPASPPQEPSTDSLEVLAKQPADPPIAEGNQPEPPVTKEPPAPAPSTPPPQDDPNSDTWANRYRTLQGVFNAEVPKLQTANRDLQAQLQEVSRRLDEMARKDKQEPPKPQTPVVDPADAEAFGADLVEMVNRVSGRAVSDLHGQVTEVLGRLARLEESLHGTSQAVAATAEDRFFDSLTRAVPDWEVLNKDEGFIAWLREADPVYGVPRGEALTAARQRLDDARVAAVFNTYKGQTSPPPPATPATSKSVEKQVSPRASNASPPPASTEKPILTQAQIGRFYDDVRRGVYRGREAEAQRVELVINEALAEGRVR